MDTFNQIIRVLGPKLAAEYFNELVWYRAEFNGESHRKPLEAAVKILDKLLFEDVSNAVRDGFVWRRAYNGYAYWKDILRGLLHKKRL